MRPKKPRLVDGIPLADNLYRDPRNRPGHYQYIRPDGTRKTLKVDSVTEANRLAEEANAVRDTYTPPTPGRPSRSHTAYHLPTYKAYREKINPRMAGKASWKNRKYALDLFANDFPLLAHITMDGIRLWWDELTHSQQKLRMAEFRRYFNWLMGECLVPKIRYNPFTTADDVPRLLLKEKPPKERAPLTEISYKKIYNKAGEMGYEALQIAMSISLYTTLREGDLCRLRFDKHVTEDELRVVVSKSEAQKGGARATRLCWKLSKHPKLRKLLNQARELALVNKACPFVLSHKPKRRVWNEDKEHLHQVLPDRLSRMFAEVRDACGIENTSFHEVRGLSSTLLKNAGYTVGQIQAVMAHESPGTTADYMDASQLPYEEVLLKL